MQLAKSNSYTQYSLNTYKVGFKIPEEKKNKNMYKQHIKKMKIIQPNFYESIQQGLDKAKQLGR